MKFVGLVSKLKIVDDSPVQYFFQAGEHSLALNPLIGHKLKLTLTGKAACQGCQRAVSKVYQQGYCFICTRTLAQCDMCILKPELCHYAQGTCREPQWGDKNCNISHIVYLTNTSGIKVGITKHTNMPTRWFDQGAIQALPLLAVPSRYHSGLIEVEIAKHIPDKTNWRNMLKPDVAKVDLFAVREELLNTHAFEQATVLALDAYKEITYPRIGATKIVSLNFKNAAKIEGTLVGLKGQYMLFEHGVLNIRNLTGYEIEFEY